MEFGDKAAGILAPQCGGSGCESRIPRAASQILWQCKTRAVAWLIKEL